MAEKAKKTAPVVLAESLCVKICHDIANSAGSISNALEMLGDPDMKDNKEDIIDLLNRSSQELVNRVKLYRVAYGKVSSDHSDSVEMLVINLAHMFESRNISISTKKKPSHTSIPSSLGKLLLNIFILIRSILMKDSSICINFTGQKEIIVEIECAGAIIDTNNMEYLQNPNITPDEDVDNVQTHYAAQCALTAGASITILKYNKSLLHIVIAAPSV